MEPSDYILTKTVTYFAVYPSGRRCSVTLQGLKDNADYWASEGVTVETHVKVENIPVYGPQVLVE